MGKQRKQQQSKRIRDNIAAKTKYRTPAVQYPVMRGRHDDVLVLDELPRERR